ASEGLAHSGKLTTFPWFKWNHLILVPHHHPLAQEEKLTVEQLAEWPLVTYRAGMTGRSVIDEAFQAVALLPNVVLSAQDSDVVKTYVRLGMGIGIIAE
ncbi:LysR substrate-binding domain-containing protein, partial [Rosenbergiella nectarea]|uniref:LysR substrate-binding domain-containing protein n=2 Tax=Rosenbergiella TaxID=1356488 RepID=UPI001F4FC18C